jgi:hypothetical protein
MFDYNVYEKRRSLRGGVFVFVLVDGDGRGGGVGRIEVGDVFARSVVVCL